MPIKQSIFYCIPLAISITGYAMELKDLKLKKTINIKEPIEKIELAQLSNEALEKLGGYPSNNHNLNDILLVTTKSSPIVRKKDTRNRYYYNSQVLFRDIKEKHAKGKIIQLLDVKNQKKLHKIEQSLFNSQQFTFLENTPYFFREKLSEIKNKPFITFYFIFSKRKDIYHYDITEYDITEQKCTIKQDQDISFPLYSWEKDCCYSWSTLGKIDHDDYRVYISKKDSTFSQKILRIEHHHTGKVIEIPLDIEDESVKALQNHWNYHIFASPKKGSRYLLVYSYSHHQGKHRITLYDNQIGKPAIINGEKVSFKDFMSNIPQSNKLNAIIFGKNEDFIVLMFENEIFLYNLESLQFAAQYNFKEKHDIRQIKTFFYDGINHPYPQMLLSNNEKTIIVFSEKTLYFFENPLIKKDIDLPERLAYLRDLKTNKTQEEKELAIRLGSDQIIKIQKSFLCFN